MQELSDRIRALPDEIEAIDAAMKTPNALGQENGVTTINEGDGAMQTAEEITSDDMVASDDGIVSCCGQERGRADH